MKPFHERNPLTIGLVGVAVIALALLGAFNVDRLPVLQGRFYAAEFAEAAGLQSGASVLIAGVDVGQVTSVGLDGDVVRVEFEITADTGFGRSSRAAIKVGSALGDKFLAVQPRGPGTMPEGSTIPVARTDTPFTITSALEQTTQTVQRLDTGQLANSLNTLATTFRDAPEEVRSALRGLTRLSRTISSRDQKLGALLDRTSGVTQVLAARDAEFVTLLSDADLLLRELDRRSQVISQLLVNTSRLSTQLTALVRENQADLEPALQRLDEVTTLLSRKQQQLQRSIQAVTGYVRPFADTVGSGRWFDTFVQNLPPAPPSIRPPGNR